MGIKGDLDMLSLNDKVVVVLKMGNGDRNRFRREDKKFSSLNCYTECARRISRQKCQARNWKIETELWRKIQEYKCGFGSRLHRK